MGRWLAVRFAAFGLKHHAIDGPGLWRALRQAFPHRDAHWRWKVAGEAIERAGLAEQLGPLKMLTLLQDQLEQLEGLEEPPATG